VNPVATESEAVVLYRMVAETIKRERLAAGWTLRELAEASGIALGYISEIERGKKDPSLTTIMALAGALGMQVVFRLEGKAA
jgi:transcriptional regulator with XRE-family HTH domain